jgi:hypothetical protein
MRVIIRIERKNFQFKIEDIGGARLQHRRRADQGILKIMNAKRVGRRLRLFIRLANRFAERPP